MKKLGYNFQRAQSALEQSIRSSGKGNERNLSYAETITSPIDGSGDQP